MSPSIKACQVPTCPLGGGLSQQRGLQQAVQGFGEPRWFSGYLAQGPQTGQVGRSSGQFRPAEQQHPDVFLGPFHQYCMFALPEYILPKRQAERGLTRRLRSNLLGLAA